MTTRTRSNPRGGISIVRMALIIGVVGLLVLGVGIASLFVDQASRQSPFDVEVYPGAEKWGESDVQSNARNVFYRTTDSPEQVTAFYQQKMNEHNGSTGQNCVRLPPEGVNPDAAVNPAAALYQITCMFDRSGFNSTQFTKVVIYPGRFDADPFLNAEGMTIVKYEQQWQR